MADTGLSGLFMQLQRFVLIDLGLIEYREAVAPFLSEVGWMVVE